MFFQGTQARGADGVIWGSGDMWFPRCKPAGSVFPNFLASEASMPMALSSHEKETWGVCSGWRLGTSPCRLPRGQRLSPIL